MNAPIGHSGSWRVIGIAKQRGSELRSFGKQKGISNFYTELLRLKKDIIANASKESLKQSLDPDYVTEFMKQSLIRVAPLWYALLFVLHV